jgi:hypothetical protein
MAHTCAVIGLDEILAVQAERRVRGLRAVEDLGRACPAHRLKISNLTRHGAFFALPRPVEELPPVRSRRLYEIYMRQIPEYSRIYMWLAVFGRVVTRPAYVPAKQQSVRRRNCRRSVHGIGSRLRFAALLWRPAIHQKGSSLSSCSI